MGQTIMATLYPFVTDIVNRSISNNSAILDIGCGPRQYADVLNGMYFGADIAVVDPKNPPDFVGDACQLDCEDSKFDLVFGVGTFSLIKDIDALLAEIRRVLVPNGQLIIFDYQEDVGKRLLQAGHCHVWNPETLRHLLIEKGFKTAEDQSSKAFRNIGLRWLYQVNPKLLSLIRVSPNWLIFKALNDK